MDRLKVFNYLSELKVRGLITDSSVNIVSNRDVDIIIEVAEDKIKSIQAIIETELYLKRELGIKSIRQGGKHIMFMTNNGNTYKIMLKEIGD